jgi:hypothetical protein
MTKWIMLNECVDDHHHASSNFQIQKQNSSSMWSSEKKKKIGANEKAHLHGGVNPHIGTAVSVFQ